MRFPGLELREPLRARPLFGAVVGAISGLVLGVAVPPRSYPVGQEELVLGYVAGAAMTGLLVGALLPQFRHRWLAGVIVALSVTVGLATAMRIWQGDLDNFGVGFFGFCAGLAYSVLLWDYKKPDGEFPSPLS